MRKISASYIFPVNSPPVKQGILIISDFGEILDIVDTGENFKETASLEYYNGILVPGFVNAHCHIELSYMKGLMENSKGLPDFIRKILTNRTNIPENLEEIIKTADDEMKAEGIVAVGDISNDDFSFGIKKSSSLYYHTFVEVFWPSPEKAGDVFGKGEFLFKKLKEYGLKASMVPHAPYSMSPELFQMVHDHEIENRSICSVHNQETISENQLYQNHSGELLDLFSNFGMDLSSIKATGKSSLQSILQYIPAELNALFVHNIFIGQTDVDAIKSALKKPFLILCPNSNLIIEQRLPDIELFIKNNLILAIGTDSYSSNHRLSVLEELKTITNYYPQIQLEKLIKWATLNGAMALGIDDNFGSFTKGKTPGVNLINGIDFENMILTKESRVKRLV